MLGSAARPVLLELACSPSVLRAHAARQLRCVRTRARGSAAARERSMLAEEEDELPIAKTIEWEGPLTPANILKYPHPKLRAPNASIGVFGEPLKKLADEMFEVMYQDDGVGLAAPQVGVNLRLMVFNTEGNREDGEEFIFANPVLISSSKKQDVAEEGCLSFPGVRGDVTRPTKIVIKAKDVNGKMGKFTIEGFGARVFQHEFDHLQGVLFHDRFPPEQLDRNRAALVGLEDAFVSKNPGLTIKRIA